MKKNKKIFEQQSIIFAPKSLEIYHRNNSLKSLFLFKRQLRLIDGNLIFFKNPMKLNCLASSFRDSGFVTFFFVAENLEEKSPLSGISCRFFICCKRQLLVIYYKYILNLFVLATSQIIQSVKSHVQIALC